MKVSEDKKSRVEFMARLSREELDQYLTQLIKPHVYKLKCACKIASMRVERFNKTIQNLKEVLNKDDNRLRPDIDFYDIWPKEWETSIWRKRLLDFFYI